MPSGYMRLRVDFLFILVSSLHKNSEHGFLNRLVLDSAIDLFNTVLKRSMILPNNECFVHLLKYTYLQNPIILNIVLSDSEHIK